MVGIRMTDRSIGGGGVKFVRDFAHATYKSIPDGEPLQGANVGEENGVEDGVEEGVEEGVEDGVEDAVCVVGESQ